MSSVEVQYFRRRGLSQNTRANDMAQLCSRCGAGGTEDRPVTCTMMEGGPCEACRESAAIYHQIRQLEEEIAELKAKRRVLATTMNANHDPFIHKLPPEIGSHIFYLSMPSIDSSIWDPWEPQILLKLGAVCRKWRQLAWATPNLWVALRLEIKPSTPLSLAESLPDLLREWLGRSGPLPLTVFFDHTGYAEIPPDSWLDFHFTRAEDIRVETLKTATDLVIEAIDLHWGRLENLHLNLVADVHKRISGSMKPNQITCLELALFGDRSLTQIFITESKCNPKYLTLTKFPPTSINIGWDNVTHATLSELYFEEYVEVLQRAHALEYCHMYGSAKDWNDPWTTIDPPTVILRPRLRSLNSDHSTKFLLDVINVPSLEEWTHDMGDEQHDCASMISLLDRSNCFLKVLKLDGGFPKDLCDLLQVTPSLESLCLTSWKFEDTAIVDDLFIRMSRSTPLSSVEGAASGSFLPHLHFMDCGALSDAISPFNWDLIPKLYYQGNRRSLSLKSRAHESHISDETALQLLQLVEEGVDLQICELWTGSDFLKIFRERMKKEKINSFLYTLPLT